MDNTHNNAKMFPFMLPIKGMYDPKSYHLLSKTKIKHTLLYLVILAFIINLFTVILPYAPVLYRNHGVGYMLDVLLPDFEYHNGIMTITDFKCDIDEENNSMTLIDTSKKLEEEVLAPYDKGILVGQESLFYKENGITTEYKYNNWIPFDSISKEVLTSGKTIAIIYAVLILIVLFSHLFLFIMLLIQSLLMYVVLFVVNKIAFKIKFRHKFRSLFNVGAYTLSGASILKAFLQSFGIAPAPFVFVHWISILQFAMCMTIACLGLNDIKKHKEANNKLKEEMDKSLSESEKLDLELGFDSYELEMKKNIKNQAIQLQNKLKEEETIEILNKKDEQ